jgi:hypothetical protein
MMMMMMMMMMNGPVGETDRGTRSASGHRYLWTSHS